MVTDALLSEFVKNLPEFPGVYRFYDEKQKLLYVGKAKNLKKRVSSYFLSRLDTSARIRVMIRKIASIEYTIVESEQDALLLENTLIKEHQPRYNIQLKDDKTYPWIVIKKEPFPRVFLTRQYLEDGSEYLGPYASVGRVKFILSQIRQMFPLRTCKLALYEKNITAGKFKVCLEYHIGNCLAPCVGYQLEKDYDDDIQSIRAILKGHFQPVIMRLKNQMMEAALALAFEKADRLKKRIRLIEDFQTKSAIVHTSLDDVEVYGFVETEAYAVVNYLEISQGAVIAARTIEIKKSLDEEKETLLLAAVIEVRSLKRQEPKEIITPFPFTYYHDKTTLTVPIRGDKMKLLSLAQKNALYHQNQKALLREDKKQKHSIPFGIQQLATDLRLKNYPMVIECFDNSNIQGTHPVASMVMFKAGKPYKAGYRHFNIKTVEGPNDFDSMKEIVTRRYQKLKEENEPLPDLIVIDGGKGQLNAAVEALSQINMYGDMAICSIAKRLEEVYLPNDPLPLMLNKKSESLKILQHIRNEAHRFAITFHRNKRSQSALDHELYHVKGIGKTTALNLLKIYHTMDKIKQAPDEELVLILGNKRLKILRDAMKD